MVIRLGMIALSFFKQFGNRVAVIDSNGIYSYNALIHLSNTLKTALVQHNVLPGDRIVVMQKNSLRSILIHLAIADLKAISVPLSTQTPVSRICEIMTETNAALCICEEFVAEALKAAGCNLCPLLSIRLKEEIKDLRIIELNGFCGNTGFKKSKSLTSNLHNTDIFTILYTSGTTGAPKGVLLSHSNIDSAIHIIDNALKISSDDAMYTSIEYNYAAGLLQLFAHLCKGAAVCTEFDLIDSHQLLSAIKRYSVTTLACVPSTMSLLMRAYGEALFPFLSSLKKIEFSSAPLVSKTVNDLHDNLSDVAIFNTYGLTEALRVTYFKFPDFKISNIPIGYVNEGVHVLLNGNENDHVSGELVISGPTMALGYLNKPEETKKAFTANGYISGDTVKIIDGLLYLEGRNSEIINIGAHRVSLVEVEQAIATVQGVYDVAVSAREHQILDKVIVADVVADPRVSKRDIIQYLKNRLEPYKIPGQINFVDEIVKSEAGKIVRSMVQ
jgi:long-chain acyl-CoA synthetase